MISPLILCVADRSASASAAPAPGDSGFQAAFEGQTSVGAKDNGENAGSAVVPAEASFSETPPGEEPGVGEPHGGEPPADDLQGDALRGDQPMASAVPGWFSTPIPIVRAPVASDPNAPSLARGIAGQAVTSSEKADKEPTPVRRQGANDQLSADVGDLIPTADSKHRATQDRPRTSGNMVKPLDTFAEDIFGATPSVRPDPESASKTPLDLPLDGNGPEVSARHVPSDPRDHLTLIRYDTPPRPLPLSEDLPISSVAERGVKGVPQTNAAGRVSQQLPLVVTQTTPALGQTQLVNDASPRVAQPHTEISRAVPAGAMPALPVHLAPGSLSSTVDADDPSLSAVRPPAQAGKRPTSPALTATSPAAPSPPTALSSLTLSEPVEVRLSFASAVIEDALHAKTRLATLPPVASAVVSPSSGEVQASPQPMARQQDVPLSASANFAAAVPPVASFRPAKALDVPTGRAVEPAPSAGEELAPYSEYHSRPLPRVERGVEVLAQAPAPASPLVPDDPNPPNPATERDAPTAVADGEQPQLPTDRPPPDGPPLDGPPLDNLPGAQLAEPSASISDGVHTDTSLPTTPALSRAEVTANPAAPARAIPPEVAPALTHLAAQGSGSVEVALSPEELGSVTLRMEQDGAGLRVTVTADRTDTLDLMRRHAGQLQQELKDAGFAGSTFSFSERGGDRPTARTPLPEAQAQPEWQAIAPFAHPPKPVAAQGSGLDLRL